MPRPCGLTPKAPTDIDTRSVLAASAPVVRKKFTRIRRSRAAGGCRGEWTRPCGDGFVSASSPLTVPRTSGGCRARHHHRSDPRPGPRWCCSLIVATVGRPWGGLVARCVPGGGSTASRWYRSISTGSVSLNTLPTGLRASSGVLLHLAVGEQRELVELLVERHPAHQVIDAMLDPAITPSRCWLERGLVTRA